MKISLKWIQQYVNITIPLEELSHRLTMAGFEVESIERLGEKYNNFVIGKVLDVQKHPKADRLSVCKVNAGGEPLQIVCGAPNVAPGQIVPVGLSGAVVPRNQHDPEGKPFELSRVKIRGVESFGMICSAYELALGDDKDGIMVFSEGGTIGMPLAEHFGLNDTMLEIGITPNRPDAMSHIGIAREIAALLGEKLNLPLSELRENSNRIENVIDIEILDVENCPRYSARVIKGVTIGESPAWLKSFLHTIGLRPVNNVVDITNYVLMEYGHPLHAFDYDTISDKKIIIKRAAGGEKFITLDHKERTLTNETLMICDPSRSIAMGGVMGGENTEISDSTTNVLLESAYFNPRSIRRSSKHFGISTDASQRFERGADPNITIVALDRAASLIQQNCGGEILKGIKDVYPNKIEPKKISLRTQRTNDILGSELNTQTIRNLLASIEILPINPGKTAGDSDEYIIPTYRVDIEREIDLIEEVARLYGYDNIDTVVKTKMSLSTHPPKRDFSDEIRNWFVGRGFREAVSNSMQDKELASLTSSQIVEVLNPISKEMSALRSSLVTGLLSLVRNNIFHGTKDIRLFELGKTYTFSKDNTDQPVKGYREDEKLLLLLSGLCSPQHWSGKPTPANLFDLKGELETFLCKVFLDNYKIIPYTTKESLFEPCLAIELNGKNIGFLGRINPAILKKFELEQDVFCAEVLVEPVESNFQQTRKKHKPLPKYPTVSRDLAVVVATDTSSAQLTDVIKHSAGPLLKNISVFDIYSGDQVPAGKKSCALSLEFISEEHTLTQEEIDKTITNIVQTLSKSLNASLRT